MLISIIIPVYNVEQYLSQCLESILSCTGFSYEIILVIRGSEDSSEKIANSYLEKNNDKIRIIQQNGKGLSNARNCGLDLAIGKYIAFFDSDDYIDGKKFMKFISKLQSKNFEILISDYTILGKNDKIAIVKNTIKNTEELLNTEYLEEFLRCRRNYWNVWQFVFQREFLINNNLKFLENRHSEDIEFSTRVILLAKDIGFSHIPYYHYRIGRENSLANVITLKHIQDLVEMVESSVQKVQNARNFKYKKSMIRRLMQQYLLSYVMIYDLKGLEKIDAIKIIKKYIDIWDSQENLGVLYKIVKILNIRWIARILILIRFIRRKYFKIH